jgi:acetyl esterase/lipase
VSILGPVRRTIVLLLIASAVAALAAAPASAPVAQRRARAMTYHAAVVVMIHGGGWRSVGPRAVAGITADRPRLRSWGYRTDVVRYRAFRHAFPDVLAAYDALRRRVGRDTPICAYGASAGAQMALMLAIRRPEVACVISRAGPTELQRLPAWLRRRARKAFGRRLARWSPAAYRLFVPILLEHATDDRIVPFGQMAAMHRVAPRSEALALNPGAARFVHVHVDRRQLEHSRMVERRFLQVATRRWRASGPLRPAVFLGTRAAS